MSILGIADYGIYSLIAGVVSMLSFFTNSLVGSTQRFLSVSQGKGKLDTLKVVFSNSVFLHVILGIIILVVLESLTPFLFSGFLNIPDNRLNVASIVYQMVIFMVYMSFIAAPYRALLVSRENIVYTSIVDVLNGVFKVIFVLFLSFVPFDKLAAYGCIMLFISLFDLLAVAVYGSKKYEECIFPRMKYFSIAYIRELFSFTGWITYSTLCIALRTQGFAVVLNKILGTTVNAAYGIGSQISGMVSFVSTSFTNAIAPQLMAAEGSGNRERMWNLAILQSKFSFLLMAMVGIPTIFEMNSLLSLWLVEVPPYAVLFGIMFVAMQIVDMLTSGLGLANRAIGNIALYTVITYTPKLCILPIGWILLKYNQPLWVVALIIVMIEIVCMLLRIPLLLGTKGFRATLFIKKVFICSSLPVVLSILCCSCIQQIIDSSFRFLVTFILSILLFLISTYYTSLSQVEKRKVQAIASSIKYRLMKK